VLLIEFGQLGIEASAYPRVKDSYLLHRNDLGSDNGFRSALERDGISLPQARNILPQQ
jgi:hypothetical protein